jgi:hypothetical protein
MAQSGTHLRTFILSAFHLQKYILNKSTVLFYKKNKFLLFAKCVRIFHFSSMCNASLQFAVMI